MSLRSKNFSRKGSTKVVVTGKRVKGGWTMESRLPLRSSASKSPEGLTPLENRRVRTLH